VSNKFAGSTYKNPKTFAYDILLKSGYPRTSNKIAIAIESILRDYCKFEVMHVDGLDPGGKAVLGLFVPEADTVMIEYDCIEVRKRFSMAHELGHAQLEYDFGAADSLFALPEIEIFECVADEQSLAQMDERTAGLRKRKEIRANQFAAHLLMPDGLVQDIWKQENKDVVAVAAALMVSKEALRYRLRDLRLK
jgi:Zn-dependent peptidase ImmA (M78 family)